MVQNGPGPPAIRAVVYRDPDFPSVLSGHRPSPLGPLCLETTLADLGRIVEEVLLGLAQAARALWPDWYWPPAVLWADLAEAAGDPARASSAPRLIKGVDKAWHALVLEAMLKEGGLPFFPKMNLGTQARQLSLAVGQAIGAFHVLVPPSLGPPEAGLGLVRGAEWLSRETSVDLAVFLPEELAGHEVFGPLLYRAFHYRPGEKIWTRYWDQGQCRPCPPVVPGPAGRGPSVGGPGPGGLLAREGGQGGERPGFPAMAGRPVRPGPGYPGPASGPAPLPGPVDLPSRRPGLFGEDVPKVASAGPGFPIEGLPHPASPIEKMLARSLELDGRLRGLFLCNQLIEARGETLMVDFYWPRGKLVVEADGYAFHRSHLAFRNDRYRDFLLTVTGRTVLRLTGYDISMDLPGSLGRIWETVKFVSRRDGLDPGRQASAPGPGPGPMGE